MDSMPNSAQPSTDQPFTTTPAEPPADASGTARTDAPAATRPAASGRPSVSSALSEAQDSMLDDAVTAELMGLSEADLSGAAAPAPTQTDEIGPGALVTGRIANIGSEDVLIDFGGKNLGTMPKAEFGKDEHYKLGDAIEVLVLEQTGKSGLLNVSRRKAKQAAILRDMKVGLVVEGVVTGMNKGGLDVSIEGLRGFIPASQVDTHFMKDISDLIGQHVRAEVTKFDLADENLVLSRRRVLMREEEIAKEQAFTSLEVGQVKHGVVRGLAEYGAFVNIGGVDGLLHISDMSWGRVNKPEDVLKVGDEIDVKIIKLDPNKKKISLSLKQATVNPWKTAGDRYVPNMRLKGRVVRLQPFGAFVELEPGVDGLLPVSEMSWTRRVRHPSEIVKEGDVIEVAILSVDAEKQRSSLGLKQLAEDPWSVVENRFPVGTKITGKVVRTTDFGAFVELGDGIDGLIHISELSDQRVKAVTDKVKPGQEVEVRVLGVDREQKRISLSMKPPPKEPTPEEIAAIEARRAAEAAAARKRAEKQQKLRGGLTIGWGQGLESLDPSRFGR
jgi:small subunit ribosomal protein S1